MASSSLPRLPPEIIDFIIQELDNDQAAFLSYGLLSKSWLQSSRCRLKVFSDITVCLGSSAGDCTLSLLEHPLCSFAPVVRRLTLGLSFASLSRATAELLSQIVATIHYHEDPIPPAALKLLFTSFLEITTLRIFTYFPTLSDAVEFACAFPLLQTLDFKPLYSSGGDILPDVRLPASLQRLRLHSLVGGETWFARQRVPALLSLSLSRITTGDLPQLQELLRLFGSSLKHLSLKFFIDGAVSVNLAHNDNLRTLELHMLQTNWMAPDIIPILETVGSKRLEKIVWGSGRNKWPEGLFFDNLDAIISRTENFPRLKKFVVTDQLVYREKNNPWFSDHSVLNGIIQFQDDEPPFRWLF
ncbi:hypothetical protein B0H10DRAFT_2022211 [Mycena sp. CBHHK59/15]|nr:hypothetical protein B0H10DRAFT_2022211 [Mycena sp. CBHHK59/15]